MALSTQLTRLLAGVQIAAEDLFPAVITIGTRYYDCATNGPRSTERLSEDGSGFVTAVSITFRIRRELFNANALPAKGDLIIYKGTSYRVEDLSNRVHEPALVLRCVAKKANG